MCYIPVNLPTVSSFLMLYSLRCGCILIWAWTMLRSLFYLAFFMVIFLLMYMPNSEHLESRPEDDKFFTVFLSFIFMIVTEFFIFMFAIHLAVGLYYDSAFRVEQYLICRFCTLMLEITILLVLCLCHNYYIGWYLVFLMIIILEFYSFIVVYSYYMDIVEQEAKEMEDADQKHDCEGYEHFGSLPDTQNRSEIIHMQLMRKAMHNMRTLSNIRNKRSMRNTPICPQHCTRRTK